jgi:hypothetical protein
MLCIDLFETRGILEVFETYSEQLAKVCGTAAEQCWNKGGTTAELSRAFAEFL